MKKMIAALMAVLMLLAACATAWAEQEARKMETAADADEWAAAFLGEHPEELEGAWAMTEELKTAIAGMGGLQGLAASLKQMGTPEKVEPAHEGEIQGYKAFYIPVAFSVMPFDIVLTVQDGTIAGISTGAYSGGGEEGTESDTFDSIALNLPVPGLGELPGILTVPKGEGPFPAVVLIHGSGSSDRDETVGSLKPFRDLAEGLAEKGIAVYRFDKRSYVFGTAMMANRQLTLYDESIEDAVDAVQLLAKQDRIDPARIFVLGHSLGGNAVPAIARELEKADVKACGFVMMAASPRPLDVLMREQYDYLYSLMPEVTAEQQAEKDAIFAELDRLRDMDALTEDDTVLNVPASYWKWLSAYDILQAAEEIREPVLLLQGEEDYQVTMEDFGIWQETLGEKANWTLISYPGLVHCFVPGLKTEGSAVYAREGRVDSRVIADIAAFVEKTVK